MIGAKGRADSHGHIAYEREKNGGLEGDVKRVHGETDLTSSGIL